MRKNRRVYLILASSLGQNILSLVSIQAAGVILPLLMVPYLARVLGPDTWGRVVYAQAIGLYVAIMVEYGFNLSAVREIARERESPEGQSLIVAGVLGAKTLLLGISLIVVYSVSPWIPHLNHDRSLLWAGVIGAGVRALNVFWYFQGIERLRLISVLNVAANTLAVIAVFVFVNSPENAIRVLLFQGAASALVLVISLAMIYWRIPFRRPTRVSIASAMRMGRSMFLFRGLVSAYTTGNVLLLGFLASSAVLGYYSGAERICKGLVNLVQPVTQALFPRNAYLMERSPIDAARLTRTSLLVLGLSGVAMMLGLILGAPIIVTILLGPGYEASTNVLRVLAPIAPLIAISNVLGLQWMLPLGLDRWLNTTIALAGAVNVIVAIILVPIYSEMGMAISVFASEAFVVGMMWVILRVKHLDPASLIASISRSV